MEIKTTRIRALLSRYREWRDEPWPLKSLAEVDWAYRVAWVASILVLAAVTAAGWWASGHPLRPASWIVLSVAIAAGLPSAMMVFKASERTLVTSTGMMVMALALAGYPFEGASLGVISFLAKQVRKQVVTTCLSSTSHLSH